MGTIGGIGPDPYDPYTSERVPVPHFPAASWHVKGHQFDPLWPLSRAARRISARHDLAHDRS